MGRGYQNLERDGKLNYTQRGSVTCIGNKVVFMDAGAIVEKSDKDAFFTRPQSDRARAFLEKILM